MHHISLGKYKTIWLVSMCSIISKHTYFLLKVNLHFNLPHFRNVSNTSVKQEGGIDRVRYYTFGRKVVRMPYGSLIKIEGLDECGLVAYIRQEVGINVVW